LDALHHPAAVIAAIRTDLDAPIDIIPPTDLPLTWPLTGGLMRVSLIPIRRTTAAGSLLSTRKASLLDGNLPVKILRRGGKSLLVSGWPKIHDRICRVKPRGLVVQRDNAPHYPSDIVLPGWSARQQRHGGNRPSLCQPHVESGRDTAHVIGDQDQFLIVNCCQDHLIAGIAECSTTPAREMFNPARRPGGTDTIDHRARNVGVEEKPAHR
jgi:hypothetical protein